MKKLILLLFVIGTGLTCFSQDAKMGNIPHGRVASFRFSESKIYPGTQREVTVYIPEQINSHIPACVYVQQDGYNPEQKLNLVLDTLIARREIPVTVGVFVTPGYLPSTNKNTAGRPNRCLEYDGLGGHYARFLLDEILPKVAQLYNLTLTKNGNDRCVGGRSSGGIAAFNAAWERPDAFSRVYCVSQW
jgi:enterochelin esterase-like enzyme